MALYHPLNHYLQAATGRGETAITLTLDEIETILGFRCRMWRGKTLIGGRPTPIAIMPGRAVGKKRAGRLKN